MTIEQHWQDSYSRDEGFHLFAFLVSAQAEYSIADLTAWLIGKGFSASYIADRVALYRAHGALRPWD
jgi:hypothetical protein